MSYIISYQKYSLAKITKKSEGKFINNKVTDKILPGIVHSFLSFLINKTTSMNL